MKIGNTATNKKPNKKQKNPLVLRRERQARFRMAVQLVFFVLAPSVYNAAFTAVKNAFSAFGVGNVLEWNAFAVQFALVMAFTLVFGRFFCGWACAFGALNDWVYQLSQFVQKKLHVKLPPLSAKAIALLQWLKYGVLGVILWLCFKGQSSLVSASSPWTAFSLLRAGHLDLSNCIIGAGLLLLLVLGMAWQERFFCQFLCPMGAVFSMLPQLPFLCLKRNSSSCPARCGACQKVCPVSLLMESNSIKEGECIRCGRCSGICPKQNISTLGVFKGDELWIDGLKAAVLLLLILIF